MEKAEYEKISGSWVQTNCNSDEMENPDEEYGVAPVVTFENNNFEVKSAEGNILIKGIFTINPNVVPKEIDWNDTYGSDAGKKFPAIYEISENTLSFCVANENMPRPSEFTPKLGHTIRIFKRNSGA